MIEHGTNGSDDTSRPLRIETAALGRNGSNRRILFDESVARHRFGGDRVTRAGRYRTPLEWAADAWHYMTGSAERQPDDNPDIEVR